MQHMSCSSNHFYSLLQLDIQSNDSDDYFCLLKKFFQVILLRLSVACGGIFLPLETPFFGFDSCLQIARTR